MMTSSPSEHRETPSLIRTSAEAMPSLAKFQKKIHESGWYILVDPSSSYKIDLKGEVDREGAAEAIAAIALLVSILACAIWAATSASSIGLGFILFFLGGFGGFIIGCILVIIIMSIAESAEKKARDQADQSTSSLRVEPTDERAWRLCETVAAIGRVKSWVDGTVDPSRRAPSILWSAIGRSLVIEKQYADAQCALKHESLKHLANDTLAKVQRERESLDAVQANLQQVLDTAIRIDQEQERIARERQLAQEKKLEEHELRERLTGNSRSLDDPAGSDTQADRSAGLATEAETIATLLAESDKMLQEID